MGHSFFHPEPPIRFQPCGNMWIHSSSSKASRRVCWKLFAWAHAALLGFFLSQKNTRKLCWKIQRWLKPLHNQALAALVSTMNINSYWFRFWNVLETTAVKFNCLELFSDFHVCCRHFESSGISVSHLFFPSPKSIYRCTMSFYVWIHLAWPNFTAQHQKTSEHNWNHILKVVFTPIFHWKLSASPSPLPSPATEQHPDSAWCAGAAPVRRWRSENQPVQRYGKWFTRTMKIRWMEAILNQLVSIGNIW